MIKDAVKLVKQCNYLNAGTVEFLFDPNTNEYYFIEVNPRLQVEHTITEEVFGVDLVQLQILIALGVTFEQLKLSQEKLIPKGFAIQCRIQTKEKGLIQEYQEPNGKGIRVDSSSYPGYFISGFYDSVIGKLIVHSNDFASTVKKGLIALDSFVIEGLETNIGLLKNILKHPKFLENKTGTKFLELFQNELESTTNLSTNSLPLEILQFIANSSLNGSNANEVNAFKKKHSNYLFSEEFSLPLKEGQKLVIQDKGGKSFEIVLLAISSVPIQNERNFFFSINGMTRRLTLSGNSNQNNSIDPNTPGLFNSPVSGYVIEIKVKEGDVIEKGTSLISLTEMKSEHSISAPSNLQIKQILIQEKSYVSRGQPIFIFEQVEQNQSLKNATKRLSNVAITFDLAANVRSIKSAKRIGKTNGRFRWCKKTKKSRKIDCS